MFKKSRVVIGGKEHSIYEVILTKRCRELHSNGVTMYGLDDIPQLFLSFEDVMQFLNGPVAQSDRAAAF